MYDPIKKPNEQQDIEPLDKPTPETTIAATDNDEQVINAPNKNKSKKSQLFKNLLLLLFCGVSVFIVIGLGATLGQGDNISFLEMIKQTNFTYFILGLLILAGMIVFEVLKFFCLIKITSGRYMPKAALKVALLGKYYDYVTPLATGGQPFQMYYLHKKGLSAGVSTAIPLAKYLIHMLVWVIFSIVILILNISVLDTITDKNLVLILKISSWMCGVGNLTLPVVFSLITLFPETGKKMTKIVIKIGVKLHIVKDFDKTLAKALKTVASYNKTIKLLVKKVSSVIILTLICILELACSISFPFFIVVAIGGVQPSWELWYNIITLNTIAQLSVSFIPTPGNSGFAEASFLIVFSGIALSTNVLFWIVLIWRFFTYYVYIIIGIGFSIFEIIRDAYRNRKEKKNN